MTDMEILRRLRAHLQESMDNLDFAIAQEEARLAPGKETLQVVQVDDEEPIGAV